MVGLVAEMTRCPRPHDPGRGADAAALVPAGLRPLVAGAAGCSPYLAGLVAREAVWLEAAADDPDAATAAVIGDLAQVALADLAVALRQAKRRIALLTALADLGGVWALETVTGVLSDFAAAAVDACLKELVGAAIARGRVPGLQPQDKQTAGGMVALAMGKMGARELNYSSDIDLIILFDEQLFAPEDYPEVRSGFVRVTREMTALLSEVTAEGYVFRTDLRLRPDASVTPVCLSMEAAERYYESVGRTWERAAYIKAAPVAGDIAAGARFLESLRPFVWRRHLDFAAIQDAHDMRLKIRDHKGLGGRPPLEGYDIKLGRGGIREIEFFAQTGQLIAGGRNPGLRQRGTCEALAALSAAGWVEGDLAAALTRHYRAHREVEHRVQMVHDAQTHALPADAVGFERLAAMMDCDVADLRSTLSARFEAVHAATEEFFAPDAVARPADPDWGAEITARWQTYPALRSPRAVELFQRLWPELQARLKEAARPDEALAQFDGFLAGLPAGVQLFALFEANPQLCQLIVDIAATAPALAQHLSRHASVFDAVIGGRFFGPWPGVEVLAGGLAAVMQEAGDYEAALNAARGWAKEWHFGIGVHHLRGLIGTRESGRRYADLAQAVLAAVWPVVQNEFARKHGAPPGRGAVVVGMGSLGAGQLHALSDLDLIVIYDAAGVEVSDGKRPLGVRPYYARLTQALVTALSAPMAQGRLYEVDMRLRPSGRQGPVATSWAAFGDYQRNEAWTWEHLALTRARAVAGEAELAQRFEALRQAVLREKGQGAGVLADVAAMRARLAEAKPGAGAWDAKDGPGRLQDIALLAQTAALRCGSAAHGIAAQIEAAVAAGWLERDAGQALDQAALLFWRVQCAGRLLAGGVLDPEAVGEGGRRFVLRETGFDGMDDLHEGMAQAAAEAAAIIAARLAQQEEGRGHER